MHSASSRTSWLTVLAFSLPCLNSPSRVRAIDCFGEPLYLAALGGGVARDALLSHSAKGIHRILTAN